MKGFYSGRSQSWIVSDRAGVRSRPVLGHLKDLHTERRRCGLSYEGQVSVWAGLNRGIL